MKKSFTLNENFLTNQDDTSEWLNHDLMNPGNDFPEFPNYHVESFNNSGHEMLLPDKNVLSNILGYSQALLVVKTEYAGVFTILMN